jgi:hypothetical protein
MHPKAKHFFIALVVFITEILIATTFSYIKFVRHFVGDFLVTILIYHSIKIIYNFPPLTLSIAVFIFSCFIELLQYFRLADVLGLPRGSVLSIILGTSFSWGDILMYFLGCLASYCLDYFYLSKEIRNTKNI